MWHPRGCHKWAHERSGYWYKILNTLGKSSRQTRLELRAAHVSAFGQAESSQIANVQPRYIIDLVRVRFGLASLALAPASRDARARVQSLRSSVPGPTQSKLLAGVKVLGLQGCIAVTE